MKRGRVQDGAVRGRTVLLFGLPIQLLDCPSCPLMPSGSTRSHYKGKRLRFPPLSEEVSLDLGSHVAASPRTTSNMASQTEMEESAPPSQLGFQEVMTAIATCQASLTNKIEAVQLDVGLIRQDLDKIRT